MSMKLSQMLDNFGTNEVNEKVDLNNENAGPSLEPAVKILLLARARRPRKRSFLGPLSHVSFFQFLFSFLSWGSLLSSRKHGNQNFFSALPCLCAEKDGGVTSQVVGSAFQDTQLLFRAFWDLQKFIVETLKSVFATARLCLAERKMCCLECST